MSWLAKEVKISSKRVYLVVDLLQLIPTRPHTAVALRAAGCFGCGCLSWPEGPSRPVALVNAAQSPTVGLAACGSGWAEGTGPKSLDNCCSGLLLSSAGAAEWWRAIVDCAAMMTEKRTIAVGLSFSSWLD